MKLQKAEKQKPATTTSEEARNGNNRRKRSSTGGSGEETSEKATEGVSYVTVKQVREPAAKGQSSPRAELASQALDLDSLDIRDEHISKKLEVGEHTENLQLFCDNEERKITQQM
ncbi:hypothetical protein J1N35_005583 [Gossypium stocksii]|uniref:Uncharacterized protein n=1 Tax=Gossypium stocksii TaxID=47602 RepID=A0A9D3WFJ0_9ROSI|nr:hypothetical protein J1N35_005583 [Gossypium stocksii]